MASTVKHLRSSTANKRPTASGLADGQLGINTASGTPGVFFKDSAGTVVKVGPAHVGSTAPNATPAGSAGNSLGELWVDNSTTINGLNYYTGSAFVNLTPSGTTTVAGLVELATDAETQTGTDRVRVVTPSGLQSKISNSISTTSSTTIASATAVKTAYDLANAALPKTGGRVTGNLEIGPAGSLSFEGSSDDGFETTLAVVNPTADRTITFPNITGTVVTTGDSGTVTSTMIANSTIVDADINASAAIAGTKITPNFGSQNVITTGSLRADRFENSETNDAIILDPSTDSIQFVSNGIERARIDSSGNVGIGTSSPSVNLHVNSVGNTELEISSTFTNSTTTGLRINTTGDSSIGRFVFQKAGSTRGAIKYNHNATGSAESISFNVAGGTDKLIIDGAGRVGIGATSPAALLNVASADTGTTPSADADEVLIEGTGNTGISLFCGLNSKNNIYFGENTVGVSRGAIVYDTSDDSFAFSTNSLANERVRIDGSGRLLVGPAASSIPTFGTDAGLQLHNLANASGAQLSIVKFNNDTGAGTLILGKSKSATVSPGTALVENDSLGNILFVGDDGTDLGSSGASITAFVDGTPGSNNMPGRLIFSTTSDGNSSPTERMRIDSDGNVKISGKVGIGDLADATLLRITGDIPDDGQVFAIGVTVKATASTSTSNIFGYISDIEPTTTSANTVSVLYRYNARQLNSFGSATVTNQYGFIAETNLTGATNNFGFHSGLNDATGRWNFYAAGTAPNYFAGDVRIGNSAGVAIGSSSSNGHRFFADGTTYHARAGNVPLFIARNTNDGTLVVFNQDGIGEGNISVAGSTVSYNPFLGSHWGRLVDGSKPDILPGTILDTVDQLIEWKQAKFTVDGEEKIAAYNGAAEAGDIVQIVYEGNSYSAIVQNEEEEPEELNKHVCVKVNDTVSSKAVFGVFLGWDDDIPENMVSTWNDLYCAAVGNYFVRIADGETLEIGSLIEADGNGCGIVQEDDIIRSKTVAKITSTIPQKVYDDGSFLVTCVLCCG